METIEKKNMLRGLAAILAQLAVAFCTEARASEDNDLVNDSIILVDSAGRGGAGSLSSREGSGALQQSVKGIGPFFMDRIIGNGSVHQR